jgi:hypothetical protein
MQLFHVDSSPPLSLPSTGKEDIEDKTFPELPTAKEFAMMECIESVRV